MDVILVSMPFAEVQRPSIALGLLRASLADSRLSSEVVYGNFGFAESIGLVTYQALQASPTDQLIGEWCFSEGLLPEAETDDEAYLNSVLEIRTHGFPPDLEQRKELVRWCRAQTSGYLDHLAHSIVEREPLIVGCSSVFQQHCASLSLLKRIRELRPETVTMMGGANCEAEMGEETLRAFPWVDCIVSGEADVFFRDLCELFADKGTEVAPSELPHGAVTQKSLYETQGDGSEPVHNTLPELDELPTPNYEDYFTALKKSPLAVLIQPGLLAESSRGCWWGERSHCKFCGLNGQGMAFRSKSADRVLQELEALVARYGLRNIQFVDKILDMSYLKTVLPKLAEIQPKFSLFYETKANLKREHVKTLAEAGVHWIQPGIESLDNRVLKLLGKGNSALMNVQLLRWTSEYGIQPSWNFLAGVPGEIDDWYEEIAAWLPSIYHLQPPSGVTRVRYDRFSPYQTQPANYGLRLRPSRAYQYIYPLPDKSLNRLAYYFEDEADGEHMHRAIQHKPGVQRLQYAVMHWQELWRNTPPILRVEENDDGLNISDTRPYAVERVYKMGKTARDVYRLCDVAQSREAVAGKLPGSDSDVEELISRRVLLDLNERVVSLGVMALNSSGRSSTQGGI